MKLSSITESTVIICHTSEERTAIIQMIQDNGYKSRVFESGKTDNHSTFEVAPFVEIDPKRMDYMTVVWASGYVTWSARYFLK
jgi:hypothetical protein